MVYILAVSALQSQEERTWKIQDIQWNIQGRSSSQAISSWFDIETGRMFTDKNALEQWVSDLAKRMDNSRIFKTSSVNVTYGAGESSSGDLDSVPVTLVITIEDGTPFLPIPYAFYNSNEGFQSGLVVNFPNVAGTLQNLTIVSLYAAPPDESDTLQWADPNFLLLGTWSGLQAGSNRVGFIGSFMRMRRKIVDSGYTMAEYRETSLTGGVFITTPLAGERLTNMLTLRLSGSPENSLGIVNDDSYLTYGPSKTGQRIQNRLQYDTLEWRKNLRTGFKTGLSAEWNREDTVYTGSQTHWRFESDASFFLTLGDRFNPSFRLLAFANTGKPILTAGLWNRGIRNNELAANAALYLNTGFQTVLFRLGGTEIHLNPFADFAVVHIYGDRPDENRLGAGAGAELIVMIDSARNLPIKFGFARDLRPDSEIGGGKKTEIEFAFALTY